MIFCCKCDGCGAQRREDGSWWCDGCWNGHHEAQRKVRADDRAREHAPEMAEALREALDVIDEAAKLLQPDKQVSFIERESFLQDLAGPHHSPTARARAILAKLEGE